MAPWNNLAFDLFRSFSLTTHITPNPLPDRSLQIDLVGSLYGTLETYYCLACLFKLKVVVVRQLEMLKGSLTDWSVWHSCMLWLDFTLDEKKPWKTCGSTLKDFFNRMTQFPIRQTLLSHDFSPLLVLIQTSDFSWSSKIQASYTVLIQYTVL